MTGVWRRFLVLCTTALCLAMPTQASYNIGVGKSDITGPVAEVIMMGFADLEESARGLLNRLYARAFVIEDADSGDSVIFVTCDLQAVFQLVHQEVMSQLSDKYDGKYSEQNVVLHATHTHAGPGGSSAYFLYDVTILGYIDETFNAIVKGIMDSIDEAVESLAPGHVRYNVGSIEKGGKNRSPEAYEANPEEERAQYEDNIDHEMRLLKFLGDDGGLRGALAFYPVHPTSLTQKNLLVSGDNKGYAEFLVEQKFDGAVVAIGISNAGDVSPNLIDNGDGTFSGEGETNIESAEIMGKRQADGMLELLEAESEELTGSVTGKLSYVNFSDVRLDGVEATEDNPYADRTCPAVVGQNFAAGTEDGRGLDFFKEGNLESNIFFQAIGGVIRPTPEWTKQCQRKEKVPLLAVGFMEPVPWTPEVLPVQVLKIGQFGLAVTNFEVTTMAGRRIRSTVREALKDAGVTSVELASISNAYSQYMTTESEYLKQNYEGASTLFGPNQLKAVQQELTRVAKSIVDPTVELDVGPTPRQFDRSTLLTLQTGVLFDTSPKGFGAVRTQPSASYGVGDTATASFYGSHPKNNLMNIGSYCDVEKKKDDGSYIKFMEDWHWDVRFHWERASVADSKSTCEWYIRDENPTSEPGTYRFRIRGYSKPLIGQMKYYEGVSDPFTVS